MFEGLPYGTNALANDMSSEFDTPPVGDEADELDDWSPSSEEEEFLFSPSDRPEEPITAGMGFGAGPNRASVMVVGETPQQFSPRSAQTLQAEGESSPGMKAFLARVERGL
jgi:hypothetical protein